MTGWTPFQLASGHWEIRRCIDSCRNGGAATAQRNSGHWENIELVRDLLVPRNSEQAQEQAQPKLSSDTDAFSYPVSSSASYTSSYALICQSSINHRPAWIWLAVLTRCQCKLMRGGRRPGGLHGGVFTKSYNIT